MVLSRHYCWNISVKPRRFSLRTKGLQEQNRIPDFPFQKANIPASMPCSFQLINLPVTRSCESNLCILCLSKECRHINQQKFVPGVASGLYVSFVSIQSTYISLREQYQHPPPSSCFTLTVPTLSIRAVPARKQGVIISVYLVNAYGGEYAGGREGTARRHGASSSVHLLNSSLEHLLYLKQNTNSQYICILFSHYTCFQKQKAKCITK